MSHAEVEAIATIAHYSNVASKMPHIFARMMEIYGGRQPTASTQIVSKTLLSNEQGSNSENTKKEFRNKKHY